MNRTHRLPVAAFAELAAGHGGRAAIGALAAGQASRRLLQLRALLDTAAARRPDQHAAAGMGEAFAVLAAAQARDAAAVAGVLAAPQVGAWLNHTLRHLTTGPDSSDGTAELAHDLAHDLAHLSAVAAAAAHRAGGAFTIRVPVRGGTVSLPTLGRADVRGAADGGPGGAVARRDGGTTRIHAGTVTVTVPDRPGADAPGWTALRRLHAAHGRREVSCWLEDLDPFRDCYGAPPAGRLDPATADRWQDLFDRAWRLLTDHHPAYADGVAAALTALVPLRPPEAAHGMSATSRGVFGAVGLTPPADATDLAVTLVHEIAHSKLGALLDLVPLHEHTPHRLYAPWRADPRPVGGLLQGTYAFTAVTELWRTQRHHLPDDQAGRAHVEFARWRDQVRRAAGLLLASGALTPHGERFVTLLHRTTRHWPHESVPPHAQAAATAAAAEHETAWRVRNLLPDPHAVGVLAKAWRTGTPCPAITVRSRLTTDPTRPLGLRRLDARQQLLALHHAHHAHHAAGQAAVPDAGPGDHAYADGDLDTAATAFGHRIATTSDDPSAWAGLAATVRLTHPGPHLLATAPELVHTLHAATRDPGTAGPDPHDLARWLTPVTVTADGIDT